MTIGTEPVDSRHFALRTAPAGAEEGRAGTTETGTCTLNGHSGNDSETIQRNDHWTWAVTSEDEWVKAACHKNDSGAPEENF